MSLFGSPNIEKLKAKHDIPGLIKLLNPQKDPTACRGAVLALGQLGDRQAVPFLLPLLKTSDEHIRTATLWALPQLDTAQAREPLLTALADPSLQIRRAAIAGLVHIRETAAIEPLIERIIQQDNDLYEDVFKALAQLGVLLDHVSYHTRLIEPFGALLTSTTPTLRPLGMMALEKLGWQPDRSAVEAAVCIFRGAWDRCVEIGAPAVEPLIAALKNEEKSHRQSAFLALVTIGTPSVEPLIAALKDTDTEVRQAAYWALIKIGSPAVPGIIATLNDEHDDIRQATARMLGQIGDARAVVPLITLFRDRDWSVRRDAYQAIVKIGKPAARELLSALSHESEEIQWGAAGTLEALGWSPPRDQIGALYWIVKGDWHKCTEIGEPAVAPLIGRLSHWDTNVCKEAIGALVRIGKPAVDHLINTLGSSNPAVRMRAAQALGMIGDKRAEQPLRDLLSDKDKVVSQIASEAVSAIQTGEMWRGTS